MSWISMVTLTAQLPDPSGLRRAASQLRDAADRLSAQAAVTRGVLDAVGPSVWTDNSSGRVRGLLSELVGELSAGYAALSQSADALDSLAGYVSSQQARYEETGRGLEEMLRDPLSDLAHGKLSEAERLISERESIEWAVRAAMGQAGDTIMAAVGLADRYHGGGQSFWSRAEQYLGWGAEELADVGSGIWDGSVQVVKGFYGLAVTAAKLSPTRMLVDPVGYYRDEEHAIKTVETSIRAIISDPKQFGEDLINLQELKKDPAHWLGELIPNVALLFASGGAGLAAKGVEGGEAIDATAEAASAAKATEAAEAGDGAVNDAARRAAAARTLGSPATGGAFAAELKGMSEANRLKYFGQVLDLTKSDLPKITQRTVAGRTVTFGPENDWSFTAERLDHGTIGAQEFNNAGNPVLSQSGKPVYGGGHHFPGFGVEDPSAVPNPKTDFPYPDPKPAFPANWNVLKYVQNTYKLLNDDSLPWRYNHGVTDGSEGYVVEGYVDGFKMKVAVNPEDGGVITSFPVNPAWSP